MAEGGMVARWRPGLPGHHGSVMVALVSSAFGEIRHLQY